MTKRFILLAEGGTVNKNRGICIGLRNERRDVLNWSIRLSHFLADSFEERGWIEADGKIAYVVGMDVIFSTALDWMAIGVLGLLRGRFWEAAVYLLFFLTVRRYAGGYHASTRLGCFAGFVGFYLLCDILAAGIGGNGSGTFWLVYMACSIVAGETVFYLLTPIKNKSKRYTDDFLEGAKKKAFICLNLWYCLAIGLAVSGQEMAVQIITAGNIVVLLILMSKLRKRRGEG